MADETKSAGDEFVSSLKSVPAQAADKLTLGPQRRAVSSYVNGKVNEVKGAVSDAKGALKDQWNQAKDILSGPEKNAPTGSSAAKPNSYKHGGVVQKTGLALVHKGEKVIPVAHHDDKQDDVHLSKHRVVMHLNHGGLHRALHVPEDENIPQDKLEAAKNSSNPHVRAMASLADTMEHKWHHGK